MSKTKIVLAYSGGLDTSVILSWLQHDRNMDVISFTADIGQGEELEPAKKLAKKLGAIDVVVADLQEEFIKDFVFPMFRANALYEGEYLLGTAIARPLIAKKMIELSKERSVEWIAHGATGKGNDQVRFELNALGLNPNIKILAPWREWDLNSRQSLLEYAKKYGIPIEKKPGISQYSMDANLLHTSYEGEELEDPWVKPKETMWRKTKSLEDANSKPQELLIQFEKGDPVALDGISFSAKDIMVKLNQYGSEHGIGRVDIVENRMVGMKSRGCYETPGGTILFKSRRALESIVLDREVSRVKDTLQVKYAELVYNGLWYSPERIMLQQSIDYSQLKMNGEVRVQLYKGSIQVTGRRSTYSLYQPKLSSFEDDEGAFKQSDATGYIKLLSLRLQDRSTKNK